MRLFAGWASGAILSFDLATEKCDDAFRFLPAEPHFREGIESRSPDGLFELRMTGADGEDEEYGATRGIGKRLALRVNISPTLEVPVDLRDEPETALFSPNGGSLIVVCKKPFDRGTRVVLFRLPKREDFDRSGRFEQWKLLRHPIEVASFTKFDGAAFNANGDKFAVVADSKLTVRNGNGDSLGEIDFGKELSAPAIVWGHDEKTAEGAESTTILLVATDNTKHLRLARAFSLVHTAPPTGTSRPAPTPDSGKSDVERKSAPPRKTDTS